MDDLATRYFRVREGARKFNTIKTTFDHYEHRVRPVLGDLPLAEINRERVEEFISGLVRDGRTHSMITKAKSALSVILSAGVAWKHIAANPALGLPLARPARKKPRMLKSPSQLLRLVAACPNHRVETMIRCAAETGLRRAEVIGLKWPDIDLRAKTIHVERTICHGMRDGRWQWWVQTPESGRDRYLEIPGPLAARPGRVLRRGGHR